MNSKTIIVLGGGTGGLVAANDLRRMLPHNHKIVLIEKNAEHAFPASFPWLMTGLRKPVEITRPVRTLVLPGVEVISSEVLGINIANQKISATSESFNFDYLVVALGAELAPEIIPGLQETSHTFYSFDGAQKLRPALDQFKGGNISLVVSSMPYKCPGAPHEGAMLVADYYRKRGLRNQMDIHLYTPESQPMPVAGPQLGEAVKQMLASKGISFHPLHKLVSVNGQTRELLFDGKGAIHYDLLIAVPPHRASRIVREAGLSNEAGWIPVDRATLKTKFANVYAIGDITTITIPGTWKANVPMMLPKAGVFAHLQAEIVAQRISDEINGREPVAEFSGLGYCAIEAGKGRAGFAVGEFFATPSPCLELRNISRVWHLGKVFFEKWWLSSFGTKRRLLGLTINLSNKFMKVPVRLH